MVTHDDRARRLLQLLPLLVSSVGAAFIGYRLARPLGRSLVVHPAALPNPEPVDDDELRNAAMKYRPIGGPNTPYPPWVRALKGKSGVYAIREVRRDGSSVVAYVGSSQSGKLYGTLTRHFQSWRRGPKANKFWMGQFTRDRRHDPGVIYPRDRVTVAVRVTSEERARIEEARLIARLKPRDNLVAHPDGDIDPDRAALDPDEVVPF